MKKLYIPLMFFCALSIVLGGGYSSRAWAQSNQLPYGSLGGVSATKINGWGYDLDAGTSPIDVEIYFDGVAGSGTLAATVTANLYRPDVPVNVPSVEGDYHGFGWDPSGFIAGYAPGSVHPVYVYLVNQPAGTNPLLGTGTITVPGTTEWTIECADCPKSFSEMSDRSLRLDSSGHPHIAYGGDHLYYAWYDGSLWHYETADASPRVGSYASLVLDAAGYPHISYLDDYNDDLKYAYKDGTGWHVETVDGVGENGSSTSLALDGAGYPHISYYDSSNDDLKYAYRDVTGWHLETVDSAGSIGRHTSLALDAAGYPHISCYDYGNEDLKYAYKDVTGWHLETVDSAGIVGYFTSLALDAAGYPHISYLDLSNSALKYSYKDLTGWHVETVDSAGNVGWDTSLALDAADYPHISYYDSSNSDLKYAYKYEAPIPTPTPPNQPPYGCLDYASDTNIFGWAYDPEVESSPIYVHIYFDGPAGSGIFAASVLANSYRPDVPINVPSVEGDYHGFEWDPSAFITSQGFPIKSSHVVYVYAINQPAGTNILIGARGIVISHDSPYGCLDGANATLIWGWGYDPDAGSSPIYAHIYFDNGMFAASVLANGYRPDVPQNVSSVQGDYHGFMWDPSGFIESQGFAPGSVHQVYVYLINQPEGTNRRIEPTLSVVVPHNHDPYGQLDEASATKINGWGYDSDVGTSPIYAHIYFDDGLFATPVLANRYRPDVPQNVPFVQGDYHGFVWDPSSFIAANPTIFTPGSVHQVYVHLINQPEGTNPRVERTLTITVPTTPPVPTPTPYASWPMYRRDAQNTGRSTYAGPSAGVLSWSYRTGNSVYSSPAIGSEGIVYVGSGNNSLYAIQSTGMLSWSYTTGSVVYSSPAAGSDGIVYIGSHDNGFYAIQSTGTLSWSYEIGLYVRSSPTIGSDGRVYVGSYDNSLYAIQSNGTLFWSYETGFWVVSSLAIEFNGRVYVGSEDNSLYAIQSNGTLFWSYETGRWVYSSPAIGSDGRVYIGSWGNRLYAIHSTGTLSWSYTTGGHVDSSPAIGSDGRVYVGSSDNRLYAIHSTGSLSWSYATAQYVHYSSPAIGSEGIVYIGSYDNRLYAIQSNGTLSWSYTTDRYVYSSPAIGSDGRVYVGSMDNRLYSFQ
jgi:outer membrane protein assembly factor BamB